MKTIEINHLKKYYGKARGVEDVNTDLYEGEILGFIGPNGAGKSTVIRVIMGLIQKTAGSVHIFGKSPTPETNKYIGYLPSEVFLYSELSVLDQLLYFVKIRNVDENRIYELANELELDLNRKIKELSFGNRKKVGIVAAFLHNPKILILDEPTSGLDPLIQQRFFHLLEIEKQKGASILLSSHVLNEVEMICDRVALIKEGVVLFNDSLEKLKQSTYKKVILSPSITSIQLAGLDIISHDQHQATYSYQGDINILLKALTDYQLESLQLLNLELEEIFMHYYQASGK